MYRQEIKDRISVDGFANIGTVVTPATIAVMREALDKAVQDEIDRWSENPWYRDHWMVHNLMSHHPIFMEFLGNTRIHEYLSRLLTEDCILYAYTSSSLPPGGSNFSRRIHVDAQAETTDLVTNVGVLLALDDFTEENGATYFLPGSHLSLDTPSDDYFFANAVRAFPKRGEAIIFNARTYHYGGVNSTDRARHAITLNACRPWMKQRFDYPRMFARDALSSLDATTRRFLGMDTRIPSSLEEYYVAPEDRLYKAGQK